MRDENTLSTSAATIWRFREDSNMLIGLNHSERSASVEELFSNIDRITCAEPTDEHDLVRHNSTARIEIGNPELKTETASNIELAFRKHSGNIQGELNIFYNNIDDYIYLHDTGEEHEGTIISRYFQKDALFTGIELETTITFEVNDSSHLDLSFFADTVRAKFEEGDNVPRIPARRIGTELGYIAGLWSAKLRATDVNDQNDTAENESSTEGYLLVDLYFDYHFIFGDQELLVFIKGDNLLDEEVRNHTSLLKGFAPEPGRSFQAGLRFQF
jgi:iron complex outermembrane receptor protein